MKKFANYIDRIDQALKVLESSSVLVLEAKKNFKQKKQLEDQIIKLKKEIFSSEELIDQAIKEIKTLRSNVSKRSEDNG